MTGRGRIVERLGEDDDMRGIGSDDPEAEVGGIHGGRKEEQCCDSHTR